MGDEQGAEAQPEPQPQAAEQAVEGPQGQHEQQHHGHAGDDVRVGQGDVVDGHADGAGSPLHVGKADGGGGARHGGDGRGEDGHQQGGLEGLQHIPVLKQLRVPLEGEAAPDRAALGGVEGEGHQHQDGGVQEDEDQNQKELAENSVAFHSSTASPSPSPKRFIIPMHTSTITIITREMAEPRWGL